MVLIYENQLFTRMLKKNIYIYIYIFFNEEKRNKNSIEMEKKREKLILLYYCGAKGSGDPGLSDIKPKAHAEE